MKKDAASRSAVRAAELVEAAYDLRVQRALHLALRDNHMRARFAEWRQGGRDVAACVTALSGPYDMPGQGPYYLSVERVRAIVYRKGEAG